MITFPTSLIFGTRQLKTPNNSTILGGTGNDIIDNYGLQVTIDGGEDDDSIVNNAANVKIEGGDGDDTLTNDDNSYNDGSSANVSMSSGNGNDSIVNTGNNVTLDGGSGNDYIISGGNNATISGDAGDDTISSAGKDLSISGGVGNDSISHNIFLYGYDKGDGDDIIYNYGSNDSITISGSTWTTSESGNNVIVTVADSGNITLDGAKGKTLNIYPNTTPTIASGVTAQDVIKKFMGSLDTTASAGKAAVDEAVSVASGGYFANVSAAIEQMTIDCAVAGNATTFLKDYCGIDLDNDVTIMLWQPLIGGTTTEKPISLL